MSKKLIDKLGPFGSVPLLLLQDKRITPSELRTYIAIQSFQGVDNDCKPGIDKIQRRAGLCRNSVLTAIKKLSEYGWITKIRRGLRRTNKYTCHSTFEFKEEFKVKPNQSQSEIVFKKTEINLEKDDILKKLIDFGISNDTLHHCAKIVTERGIDYLTEKITLLNRNKKKIFNPPGWLSTAIIEDYTNKSIQKDLSDTKSEKICPVCQNKIHSSLSFCPICSLEWTKREDPDELEYASEYYMSLKGEKNE